MCDVAELAPRRGGRLFRRFAALDSLGDGHGEVGANLVVEVGVPSGAGSERPLHDSPSVTGGCIKPAIACESCSHLERSTASWLRPAGVSL